MKLNFHRKLQFLWIFGTIKWILEDKKWKKWTNCFQVSNSADWLEHWLAVQTISYQNFSLNAVVLWKLVEVQLIGIFLHTNFIHWMDNTC